MQNEKVVETKACRYCQAYFDITDKDLEFYEKASPSFLDRKYLIPSPTLCPACRRQNRQSFINERNIYRSKSRLSWKDIVSMYSPDKGYMVYSQDEWWWDWYNALKYWRDFDFSRWFFEQFNELMKEAPLPCLNGGYFNMVNSEFNNAAWDLKNCYLTFQSDYNEDCYYSYWIAHCNNSSDLYRCYKLENSYGCVDCTNSYKLYFSQNCDTCSESYFLQNCIWCTYCFNCTNLNNKKYYIDDVEYSQNDYYKKLDMLLKEKTKIAKAKNIIVKENHSLNSENSLWDYIYNCKNCLDCYDSTDCEDCKFIDGLQLPSNNCYDISQFWWDTDLCYDGVVIWKRVYNSLFSAFLYLWVTHVLYSFVCLDNCSNLFWCVWLRNKQYCILNKQYTKEEYEALVPRIIEHMMNTPLDWGGKSEAKGGVEWWEFFPSSLSPFGYNETVAMEYYPLTRDQISEGKDQNGKNIFNWSDYEAPFPRVEKIIPADKLPDDISKIPDDILNWAIECEVTGKPFRIIKQELEFYRKHNLPIPRRHPDQRHLDRMALRNPRKLFERKCDKCGVEMVTTYSPERKEVVYCEDCYNKEVVG